MKHESTRHQQAQECASNVGGSFPSAKQAGDYGFLIVIVSLHFAAVLAPKFVTFKVQ